VKGTQINSPILKSHLYESKVVNGNVKVYKIRKFIDTSDINSQNCDNVVTVSETITGETTYFLRWITEIEAQKAHKAHMKKYKDLFDNA
jgi:hypothetical protein